MQSLIPDPRAASEKKSNPAPTHPQIYAAGCLPRPSVGLGEQQATTITRSQALLLNRKKMSSLPARRRLRTLAPVTPLSPTLLALRKQRQWPPYAPCSLPFQTGEFLSPYEGTPLSTLPEQPIPKKIRKYEILQIAEQAAKKLISLKGSLQTVRKCFAMNSALEAAEGRGDS
jgi:hypothetical protein